MLFSVLRGVSLSITEGQVIALLGANGAGKTTTLKAISGLLRTEVGKVSHGDIHFDGQRIDRLGPEQIARNGIIQVLEGRKSTGAAHRGRKPYGGHIHSPRSFKGERRAGESLHLLPQIEEPQASKERIHIRRRAANDADKQSVDGPSTSSCSWTSLLWVLLLYWFKRYSKS